MNAKISPEIVEHARKLRASGANWAAIARIVGVSVTGIQRHLDPGMRARNNASSARSQLGRSYRSTKPNSRHAVTLHRVPPPEVLDELRRCVTAPRTLSMVMFGDPLPGRSALDQIMSRDHLVAGHKVEVSHDQN